METFSTCGTETGTRGGGGRVCKDGRGEGEVEDDDSITCGIIEDDFRELIDKFDKIGPGRAKEEFLPHPLGDNP